MKTYFELFSTSFRKRFNIALNVRHLSAIGPRKLASKSSPPGASTTIHW